MTIRSTRRRRLLAAAGAAAGLCAATGAGAAAAADTRVVAGDGGGSGRLLEITGPWEIAGLSAAQSGHFYLRMQVAETLLDAAGDGSPRPGLAQRWRVSDDGLEWRFDLRETARFHDGTPVTAASVLPSLRLAQVAPSLLSQAPIAAIEADGERTLRIRLTQPHAALASLLAHATTVVLAPSSFGADGRSVRQVIGSGPYRIAELKPPQLMQVVWHEGHGGPRPSVTAARYLAVGRAETRALMAAAGQADLVFGLDPASLMRLRRHPGRSRVVSVTLPRIMMLKVNAGHPWLREAGVRRALSLAIDREGIAQAILREPDLAAGQLFPPTAAAWHDATRPPLRFDVQEARRHLAAAGWRLDADGWRDRGGVPVRLTLRTFPDRPELPIVATALQEQWRQLGIPVRVAIGNSGDIPLGHRDRSLHLGLLARNYATAPDPTPTLARDFGPDGADWGALGWHDGRVSQSLAALARGGLTDVDAARLRGQAMDVLHDELPVIPVTWYRLHVAAGDRIDGVVLDPFERSHRIDQLRWTRGAA